MDNFRYCSDGAGTSSSPLTSGVLAGNALSYFSVVDEQEEHGGSERALELSEDSANEVVDTASESSVRTPHDCKFTSVSPVQARS